jgi:hypothetical protein
MRSLRFHLAVLTVFPMMLWAQSPVVEITPITASVSRLSLSDIDFAHSTTPKWLFTLQLHLVGAQSAEATMRITTDVSLATGESFSTAYTITTVPFTIEGSRTFTNIDFVSSGLTQESRWDEHAKQRFEEIALPAGTLPAGVYLFRVEVTLTENQRTFTSSFRFVLTNPSALELFLPRDGDNTISQFPLFQWIFDGDRSRIVVYEKLPGQRTLEETASGIPHLDTEVNTTSLLYPVAGVRPLERGKTYVWFVEGIYGISGGTSTSVRSPLHSFTVASEENPALATILEELERVLGPKYKGLFDQIRSNDLSPTGIVRIDGVPISTIDLLRLIGTFRENPGAVLSADIE